MASFLPLFDQVEFGTVRAFLSLLFANVELMLLLLVELPRI